MNPDLSLATQILKSAFESLQINVNDWYDSTVYDGSNASNNQTSEFIREQFGKMKRGLGWSRYIPSNEIAKFVCSCLGYDLLRYSPVRTLLVKSFLNNMAGDEINSQRLALCDALGLESSVSNFNLTEQVSEMSWRPSSKSAIAICQAIGLPSRFAVVGSSENLEPILVANPVERLYPLLDFQEHVKSELISVIETKGRTMVCMPTGAGKTRTTVEALLELFSSSSEFKGGILWIADRQELCEQAVQTFYHLTMFMAPGTPIYRLWGGMNPDIEFTFDGSKSGFSGIVVTSTQQLRSRLKSRDLNAIKIRDLCDVIIIDEAHRNLDWCIHFVNESLNRTDYPSVIGLTATPRRRVRNETTELARIFGESMISPLPNSQEEFSSAVELLTNRRILAKRIDVTTSDLEIELQTDYNSPLNLNDAFIVATKLKEKYNLSSVLVFTESVEQSKSLSLMLNMAGYSSKHIDGSTPPFQRKRVIDEFRDNNLQFLTNYDILTTGFDAPRTDGVIILRATEDVQQPLIIQMIGRGLRGPEFGGSEKCYFFIRGESS
jgi:DNA repair protein RadD